MAKKSDEKDEVKNDMPDDGGELEFEGEGAEEAPEKLKKKAKPAAPVREEEDDGPKLVKRTQKEAPIVNKVEPRRAFILDRSGKKQKHTDESRAEAEKHGVQVEDGTEFLEYAHGQYHSALDPVNKRTTRLGYVNANGVLFPPGFKFRGGHIAHAAPEYGVVLNVCPKCKHRQGVEEAVQGECGNMKLKDADGLDAGPCGYSAYEELDSYELAE